MVNESMITSELDSVVISKLLPKTTTSWPAWSRQNITCGGGFAVTTHFNSTRSPDRPNVIPDGWIRGATAKKKEEVNRKLNYEQFT